jgi:hypothetical protein
MSSAATVDRFSSAASFDSSGANAAIAAARIRSRASLRRFARAGRNGSINTADRRTGDNVSSKRPRCAENSSTRRANGSVTGIGTVSGLTRSLDALRLPIGKLAVNRLEIVEMMKHDPQRDTGAFSDSRRSGPQVPLAEKIEQRINHGVTRARRPRKASVERCKFRHQAVKLITFIVQLQARRLRNLSPNPIPSGKGNQIGRARLGLGGV